MFILSKLLQSNPLHLFLGFVGIVVGWALAVGIYRVYYHPLAQFPGPLLAKISQWPSFWHSLRGDRHIWLWQCQQIYGPEYRFEPDSVVFNTASAYRTIYGVKANVKKSSYYDAWPIQAGTSNTWNETNVAKHGRKRRFLNNAFSDRAVRTAEPFIIQHVNRMCELISHDISSNSGWTRSFDMSNWANYMVFDILTDLCFGKSFHIKEAGNEKYRFVPHLMGRFGETMHTIGSSPILNLWLWLKPRGLDRLFMANKPNDLRLWSKFVFECLGERQKLEDQLQDGTLKEAPRQDIFHHIFEGSRDPETGELTQSLEDLYMECELMLIAGSDTTSTTLAAMCFFLSHYPRVQEKLAQELRTAFSSTKGIHNGPVLQSLVYLRAVINETLRMSPPVPSEMKRSVLSGGQVIDDKYIPEGFTVATAHYCLDYSEEVYPDPFTFRPERWIVDKEDGTTAKSVALAEEAFCAFSTGTRGCVGKNLALMELNVVTARIFWEFEIRLEERNTIGAGGPEQGWGRRNRKQYQVRDGFISLREGPIVQFRSRG